MPKPSRYTQPRSLLGLWRLKQAVRLAAVFGVLSAKLVVAIEATPAFSAGFGEFEDHGQRSLSIFWSELCGGAPA